jgi:hypothetical protein
MPLAVNFQFERHESIFKMGALISQAEQCRLSLRPSIDPVSAESRLGTEDDVFTYAGTFRYRPGAGLHSDANHGIGLLYHTSVEFEYDANDSTATPFDSGSVFQY